MFFISPKKVGEINNELNGYVITREIAPYQEYEIEYDHNNQYWDYDGAKSEFFNDVSNHNMALEV